MPAFAIAFPMIDPVAFSVGPLPVRWYALAYIAGLIGGWFYARRLAASAALWTPTQRPQQQDIDDLVVFAAIGVVGGGRLGYVLFYNLKAYLADPLEIFAIWHGGMSFHGGLAGAAAAIVLFARSRGLNALAMLDLASVVAPIGLFFGRIANFIKPELWGRPAPDFPYAVIFPGAGDVPRHPSQLYEAFAEGLLLFIITGIAVRLFGFRRPGLVGGIFILGYALARIGCEFFREPDEQLGYLFGSTIGALGGGVTMGMLLSVPMALLGIGVILFAGSRKPRPAADPA